MKICAFEVREDEKKDFTHLAGEFGIEITCHPGSLTMDNISICKGCEGVAILGESIMDEKMLDALKSEKVLYVATRSIGYNHINLEYAKKVGIKVCNSNYPSKGVADYTVMLILMSIRNFKRAFLHQRVNDYSLNGLVGREMKDLAVGIVGTGRIGFEVINNLSGFGCRMMAYDVFENENVKKYAEYVSLETLYEHSDVITFHLNLNESTYHMVNDESLEKMKDGVILINCARGEIMNNETLIRGIENGKIGGLALDVLENEEGIYHHDKKSSILKNRDMAYLRQFPNVVLTPHIAFYTDKAVSSMVRCAVEGIYDFSTTGTCKTQL